MNESESRDMFKAYFTESFGQHFLIRDETFARDADGEYIGPSVMLHWETWQAARKRTDAAIQWIEGEIASHERNKAMGQFTNWGDGSLHALKQVLGELKEGE